MTIGRARIIPGAASPETTREPFPLVAQGRHRRIIAEEMQAREAAQQILARARAEAEALLTEARRAAEDVARDAALEARQAEEAKLASLYLHLKNEDEKRAERDLDRAISLAVLLSERLLGKALVLDANIIADLARQALSEARGARRVVISASPLDVEALERHVASIGFGSQVVEARADAALPRGALHLSTNLGNLDAQLRPQLERLARALRDTLQRG